METTLTLEVRGFQGDYFVACEDSRGTYWVFTVTDWDGDGETVEILWSMDDERPEDPTTSRDDFEQMLDGVLDTFIERVEAR